MRIPLLLMLIASLAAAGCAAPDESADDRPAGDDSAPDTDGGATPGPSAGSDEAGPATARIIDLSFQPADLTIAQGETVTWTNDDSFGHTVTADDDAFASDTLVGGATFTHTFDESGSFPYHCEIHPGMKGTIVVE